MESCAGVSLRVWTDLLECGEGAVVGEVRGTFPLTLRDAKQRPITLCLRVSHNYGLAVKVTIFIKLLIIFLYSYLLL